MSRTDGRAPHAVFGTAALALLVTAVCAVVVGLSPATPAQAAPKTSIELGLGKRTVDIVETVPAVEKAQELASAGTALGDSLSGRTTRKPTPIRVVAPTPATSSASRASTGGWSTARVSWYGPGFYGNTMAGGGTLTETSMVVAHRSLPFGTVIQFEYNGRSCTAVVQDRGPFIGGRTFDLGPGTAKALGFSGVGTVRYRIVGR